MKLILRTASSWLWTSLGVASIIAAWELVGVFGFVPRSSVPGPASVGRAVPIIFEDPDFLTGVLDTAVSWLLTVLLAAVAAVSVGLIASSIPFLQRPTEVLVDTFRSVPATALIPIAILIFGLGTQMKVSVAIYAVFWPILINTVYGAATTEPMRIDAARSMRWGWWRRQVVVRLPSAAPSILTGIRVSVGIALIVIISTELLGARSGVGTVLMQYMQADRPDAVYAGILFLGVAGATAFSTVLAMEKKMLRWAYVD